MHFMKIIVSLMLCTGCTYNVSMAHTDGTATDIIDDNATNTPTISPDISIPSAI